MNVSAGQFDLPYWTHMRMVSEICFTVFLWSPVFSDLDPNEQFWDMLGDPVHSSKLPLSNLQQLMGLLLTP